ncbi:hypothetical protein K2173_006432 [Erythroxylum novogranatense]|uniref:Uncharacterized protein n=1 Tax=Erythroxylum novogranatense TaxID=1862640 RepID=A0AAV8U3A5_9ROSI|nr:hypothetical protein K2173_006432 [Erythroxylum novogranatense]
MAETQTTSKRQREETHVEGGDEHVEESKRHKSYNHILSLLEEEEDEPTQDLSSLITTLQQELSTDSTTLDVLSYPTLETDADTNTLTMATATLEDYPSSSSSSSSSKEDEEGDRDRVIRHLLEASDDELGLPNREENEDGFVNNGGDACSVVDGFSLCDELWEFEDFNANYYALVQSEVFM